MNNLGRRLLPLVIAAGLAAGACSPVAPSSSPGASAAPTGSAPPPSEAAPAPTATPRASVPSGPADAAIQVVARGLSTPLGLVAPPDDTGRLFVVEQTGRIWILRGGAIEPEPFLDLSDRLVSLARAYDERGLLGLAFDPDFASSGRFFVYYSAPVRPGADAGSDHTNTLSELRVAAGDPDRADPASERFILRFEQPQPNHSGGALGFGPDGLLYLGTGDGGGQGDADAGHSPQGNAQDRQKLNGKILRLDVLGATDRPYRIPRDNPFVSGGGRPEIYAYGLRNPFRLTWEPDGARRLLVGDVGFGRYEEVDVIERGGNYGWRVREGAHCLNVQFPLVEQETCDLVDDRGQALSDPVLEYTHAGVGIAVIGGYIYRGAAIPALRGRYVFADYSRDFTGTAAVEGHGTLLVADPEREAGATWAWERLALRDGALDRFVTGMGEDAAGELYVLTRTEFGPVGETGEVLQLVAP